MLHKAPAGSPSDERLETREWIVFVFRNEDKKRASCKACSNKKTWRIEKSPTPESLRLQLESHLHKC